MACDKGSVSISILMDYRAFHITSCHWTGYLPNLSGLLTHPPNQQLIIFSMASSSSHITSTSGRQTTRRVFQGTIHSQGSTRGASPFVFNTDSYNVSVFIVAHVLLLTMS